MIEVENSAASSLTVREVTGETPELLEILIQMFVETFPHDRRYAGYIRECAHLADKGTPLATIHQWVFENEGEYIGFRLFNYLRQRNFGFSRYVGVMPQYRGNGFGRMIHELSVRQISRDAAALGHPTPIGLCGELDHPIAAPDQNEKQIREERLEIFRRLGVFILEDMDYYEPHMIQGINVEDSPMSQTSDPDRMLLYLAPVRPITQPSADMMATLVVGVLVDNYRLSTDSWFIRQALASIGQLDNE